jgi:isoquinoline 1-oxidoreductase subunit beta
MPDLSSASALLASDGELPPPRALTRRRFLGYLIAAPTVIGAAPLFLDSLASQSDPAAGAIPDPAQPAEIYDLTDLLTDAALPTSGLITVAVNADGTASFALPRAEVGQGITTAVAMIIADELDLPIDKVNITLADATPELLWNQLTGGSNTIHSIYTPLRVAAAAARQSLLQAAAARFGGTADQYTVRDGIVTAPSGATTSYAALATTAAAKRTVAVRVQLKSAPLLVGSPQRRIDALDIVTGRKQFTMDLDVPGALPTMVCRPPTINGTVAAFHNLAQAEAMPGVTDVAIVATGVAVRAATFGQCIDAIRMMQVSWGPGTAEGKSDESVLAELRAAELPFVVPPLPLLASSAEQEFVFYFASNSPLETNCAIADVTPDSAEIWSSLKSPIVAQETIAERLGLPVEKVTCHVAEGGGSFGRHLFFDAALEAAEISQKMGKPVKLMWHRTDDFRQGRTHPMCTSRVRIDWLLGEVLSYEQRHTSISTDFSHGLGEIITAFAAQLPVGKIGFSQTVFEISQYVPYSFGVTDQLLNEVDAGFNTGSMRNIYSPDVTTARELMIDAVAAQMGQDAYQFRRSYLDDSRALAVLDAVAEAGNWGRAMPALTAQGLAVHSEYKSRAAVLVEIDCTPATVNRTIVNGVGGPRVTKVVVAVDVGLPINPLTLEAQMMGGAMDGVARVLTYSLHIRDGIPLEGSWDNAYYTRQWNAPLDLQVIVMPPTTGEPGGAGELGVAPSMAAVACAYARATGTMPTSFPINHNNPLGFVPLPVIPPIPEEPTDGLSMAF